MTQSDPEPDDTLRRLEQRLDRASAAAERLADEVARAAAGEGGVARAAAREGQGDGWAPRVTRGEAEEGAGDGAAPPPQGWQLPEQDEASAGEEFALFAQLIHSLRELIPPELQRRLTEALRELLLAMRALIDWYVERLYRRPGEPQEVQDIPIS